MSVLAHIVLDGTRMAPEPAATKAFAYILNSDQAIARVFVSQVLAKVGITLFELGRIQGKFDHEGNRPDLVIHDAEKRPRLIVEFKFWAELTDNQPVGYLNLLPDDEQSALLFVVPRRRLGAVWRKVRRRCENDGLGLEEAHDGQAIAWAQVAPPDGSRFLAITSWEHVLEGLIQGVDSPDTESNIRQLQGLTEQVTRRIMESTALIVWWYGPYQGIDAFRENTTNRAQLYMAVSDGEPRHIGATAEPDVRFDVEDPNHDDTFAGLAADGCELYVGEITPGPASGLAAAAQRAADALRCVVLDDPSPDGYVSLYSSFYAGEIDDAVNDFPPAVPPPGFPIVVAFNPVPAPERSGNWTIVRVPRW